jgi:hypothetical protein
MHRGTGTAWTSASTSLKVGVSGDGNDDVGRFLIVGRYDVANRECWWTKTYPGSHDVFYRGFREGKGIWGTWEIGVIGHGGFHIWPKGDQEAETEAASAETVAVDPLLERRDGVLGGFNLITPGVFTLCRVLREILKMTTVDTLKSKCGERGYDQPAVIPRCGNANK